MSTVNGLSACAESALGGLGREVLGALFGICTTAKTYLEVVVVEKNAILYSISLATLAAQAQQLASSKIVDEVRSISQVVPISVVSKCTDLSPLYANLEIAMSFNIESAIHSSNEAVRYSSLTAELSNDIDNINLVIRFFDDLQTSITNVLNVTVRVS